MSTVATSAAASPDPAPVRPSGARCAPVPPTRARCALVPPTRARCALVLARVTMSLRLRGFVRTYRAVARRTPLPSVPLVPSHAEVEEVARRVAWAAAFWPGRARCLEQSLALWSLLRALDVPCALRVGAQPIGFAAHAWVEYRGQPVLESELVRTVVPFPPLPE